MAFNANNHSTYMPRYYNPYNYLWDLVSESDSYYGEDHELGRDRVDIALSAVQTGLNRVVYGALGNRMQDIVEAGRILNHFNVADPSSVPVLNWALLPMDLVNIGRGIYNGNLGHVT